MDTWIRQGIRALLIVVWMSIIVRNFSDGLGAFQISMRARTIEMPRVLWYLRLKGIAYLLGGSLWLLLPWFYRDIWPLLILTFATWTAMLVWPVLDPVLKAKREEAKRTGRQDWRGGRSWL